MAPFFFFLHRLTGELRQQHPITLFDSNTMPREFIIRREASCNILKKMLALSHLYRCWGDSQREKKNAPGCADFVIDPASVTFYIPHEFRACKSENYESHLQRVYPLASLVYCVH